MDKIWEGGHNRLRIHKQITRYASRRALQRWGGQKQEQREQRVIKGRWVPRSLQTKISTWSLLVAPSMTMLKWVRSTSNIPCMTSVDVLRLFYTYNWGQKWVGREVFATLAFIQCGQHLSVLVLNHFFYAHGIQVTTNILNEKVCGI